VLAIFFSSMASASAVAQEKDRRTLELLLLTNLSNSELVLGKLLASLLSVLMLLTAGLPFFMLTALFGGVSFEQILRVFAVTVISALAAGSLGSMIALWREKTFQTLALTALALAVLAGWEVTVASGALRGQWQGVPITRWAQGLSPGQALLAATRPDVASGHRLPWFGSAFYLYVAVAVFFAAAVNLWAMARVRVWNPSREVRPRLEEGDEFRVQGSGFRVQEAEGVLTPALSQRKRETADTVDQREKKFNVHAAAGVARHVWDNPVLWREICTWAYGKKVIALRAVYLLIFAATAWGVHAATQGGTGTAMGLPLVVLPLVVLSLVLVNALAVTSITSERDLGALDLLLVTDISPLEFILGKLGGVFYVAKEVVALPLALCAYLWWTGAVSLEILVYLVGGLALMDLFVATLGIHAGLAYTNSRSAVAVSLGTVFFLFVGVATCMRIMVSFSGSYELQLAPFLAFMIGGSAGLFAALGARNPSQAIGLASLLLPVLTFVAITGFLQGETLGVFLIVAFTYGLTTTAMLVPAISEFDVATGRTTE
jgi:ABC-type Na+ efflux pump permease subunit